MRNWKILAASTLTATVAASGVLLAPPSHADALPGHYVAKSGTVYDTKTKLTWQQDVAPSSYGAADAAQYCATLSLGTAAWRLPTLKELATVVDETRADPAIDATAFPNTPAKPFWTSSGVAGFAQYAWTIEFSHGGDIFFDTSSEQLVRCVR